MPEPEIDPDPALVRALLRTAPPPWRALAQSPDAPRFVARGWDNAIYRLDGYAVRLPVRSLGAQLVANEARWAATLVAPLAGSGVRAPVPVHVGEPAAGYPWPWTIVPWLEGELLDALLPAPVVEGRDADLDRIAADLADALAAIHRPAPPDAPRNPYRGCPLADRAACVAARRGAVRRRLGGPVTDALSAVFDDGVAAPAWTGPPLWLHGDVHPRNLLHRGGRLVGLLDLGDLGAGDPACDLAIAWTGLTARAGAAFGERLAATRPQVYDDAMWRRARAWAVLVVTALVADDASAGPFARVVAHATTELIRDA